MDRRKFLGLGIAAVALVPATLSAVDFRTEKPDTWKATTTADAIKGLYGDITPLEEGVTIKAPKLAENGGAIPVFVKSDKPAKSVALFQDANPRSAVAVWSVPENGIVDYGIKIKMRKTGKLTAILEGTDGKFYSKNLPIEVSIGGCGG
ncbi:Sulfur oxidation protein SoxY [hydrothermal vent metagenome]|uniref:Sulfur oxidation protein SoxY n=1 Tax=hydrothermal vent metagenome TaxID=652676 RepID=A0A1W1EJF2_9ZZZZ